MPGDRCYRNIASLDAGASKKGRRPYDGVHEMRRAGNFIQPLLVVVI